MATTAAEDFGQAFALFLQIVFSPIFPVLLITLCGVSFLLTFSFGLPQFALFADLSVAAFQYSLAHSWAMAALVVFILAALPLAWVGFREAETRTSRVIGYWIVCALYGAGTLWLASAWPFSGTGFQQLAFGCLLFIAWAQVSETVMITVKLVALSRPQPGPEVVEAQKAHGDAAVASEAEALSLLNPEKQKRAAKPEPQGGGSSIYLGRYLDLAKGQPGTELTYTGERHLLLFGPNGSGKGTRLLVPNLLRLTGRSIVVIDPKGELTAITSDYRRTVGEVVVLNPFNMLDLGGAGFNPLASLDPEAATFVDDATGVGEALIKVEDKDPHWSESAQSLLVALLMWEVKSARREKRSPLLENVRRLLTEPNEYARDENGKSKLVKGLRITAARMAAMGGFEIESLVGRFLRDTDEIASIQSTADRQTNWMLSPLMRAIMARNDIDFAALKERPITVYLILPAERMRTHSVWLRLVIVSALRALYRAGGLRTLFMLDEFAQLGHLGPIEDAFGLVRGFGVQIWPVLQDLNQLKALYKERWETFVGNAGVVQGFAPNDLTTAKWMSRRAGDTTVTAAGYNVGDSQTSAGHGSMSTGLSYGQVRRALFLPQELMDFPAGAGLLWPAGTSKSVPFYAPSYWEIPELKSRARNNPYYAAAAQT